MADKTWTAIDLLMGKMTIIRRENTLSLERRYQFLDSGDNVLTEIATSRLNVNELITDVPASILAALATLDVWTKNQALEQEGML